MKCDGNCDWGEEASIFFSNIEDNKVTKVNLCKHCAEEKGIDDSTGYSLIDLLQGMGKETSSGKREKQSNELTCENCGFTQSDFKKTGRFGCARCYQVFHEGLESLLEAMHKNTEHAGKVPAFAEDLADSIPAVPAGFEDLPDFPLDSLDEFSGDFDDEPATPEMSVTILKDKLDLAISEEDYEEAARLRDQIAQLEAESSQEN